jgi:type IV secretion system protein VirB5
MISTCAAVWLAAQTRVVPYVVEVDKLGEAIAVHRVSVAPPVDPGRVKAQLARWVVDTRTVYSDATAEKNIATEAFDWTDRASDADSALMDWFQKNNPTERAKKETVGVAIENAGQIGSDTYSVDFAEEHHYLDGNTPTISHWRATIKIKINPPADEATILANPGGVYVTWWQVTARVGRS